MTHPILALQAADTRADQLRHRRSHLPEQEQVDAAHGALTAWERRRDTLQRRLDELDAAVARSEEQSHEIDVHRLRLEQQLKTVIAPREAEALMHEITLLNERRSGLDDSELESLEEQAQVDDELQAHRIGEESLRAAAAAADEQAALATAAIDAELAEIAATHEALRSAIDAGLLRRYDSLRTHHMVAAAQLNGHRCEGCHMDLSNSELDEVKAAADSAGLADCPQCGRLLVL